MAARTDDAAQSSTAPGRSARLEAALAELAAAIRAEIAEAVAAQRSDPPALLSVEQVAERLGIGRSLVYDCIGDGRLRSVKVGRRRLVPADALDEVAV